jgi:hypothetical protein
MMASMMHLRQLVSTVSIYLSSSYRINQVCDLSCPGGAFDSGRDLQSIQYLLNFIRIESDDGDIKLAV